MKAMMMALLALLAASALCQPDCTLPELDNAHAEGLCGAGSLGAGETCEPQCAEGFEATGTAALCQTVAAVKSGRPVSSPVQLTGERSAPPVPIPRAARRAGAS
jgi:hypothetical protein